MISLSVVLPVSRGLPYLGEAVGDVMKQDLDGEGLELVVCVDGDEDDWHWLVALAGAIGGDVEEVETDLDARPALEDKAQPSFFFQEEEDRGLSPGDVAKLCRPEHRLKVVRYGDKRNRGQGAAMSLALQRSSRTEFLAQMEADDVRPRVDAYKTMIATLRSENWDAVCSEAFCFGTAVSDRMMSYCEWQNSLQRPDDLAESRFIEIPALHQTAMFRRSVVDAVLDHSETYRDGPAGDGLDTPVDLWWWLSFFHRGFRCGRVIGKEGRHLDLTTKPPSLSFFGWRQHAKQRTRAQGRLAVANLRRIKIHFLLQRHPSPITIISVGATLAGWATDLRARSSLPVTPFEWRPPKSAGGPRPPPAEPGVLRLWAYGDANVRRRVSNHVSDWRGWPWDLFVA